MGRFGITEILILLGIALLLFGGSRIAGVGKGLGEGIRNFKKGLKEGDEEAPKLTEGTSTEKSSSPEPVAAQKLASERPQRRADAASGSTCLTAPAVYTSR